MDSGTSIGPFTTAYSISSSHAPQRRPVPCIRVRRTRQRKSGAAVCLIALALLCSLFGAPSAEAATRGLDLGFSDAEFSGSDPGPWYEDARAVGARIVRVQVRWASVAPTRPLNGADPNDPAYRWSRVDEALRDATWRGFRVLPFIYDAPRWAEGPDRAPSAPPGTWLPDPQAFGRFAEAAARRYGGILYWQVWNEPNLADYLSPQWSRRAEGRWIAVAPDRYRRMLNLAYAGIKRAHPGSRVLTAGTAPYGDPPGGARTSPAKFWRLLLKRRTHFDIVAHHPYSYGSPRRHATNTDDVTVPDLGRVTRIVRAAVRAGTALPRAPKPLWITEISWDSNPPDPFGIPSTLHARWLTEALYLLWKQGAQAVLWYQVRDAPPLGGYFLTSQSGVFQRSGLAKLAARAFAFPVACERIGHGQLRVWGKAPLPGRIKIVQAHRTIRQLDVGSGRVFLLTVRNSTYGVHARVAGHASLTCKPR
jgi:hypothetical protein